MSVGITSTRKDETLNSCVLIEIPLARNQKPVHDINKPLSQMAHLLQVEFTHTVGNHGPLKSPKKLPCEQKLNTWPNFLLHNPENNTFYTCICIYIFELDFWRF